MEVLGGGVYDDIFCANNSRNQREMVAVPLLSWTKKLVSCLVSNAKAKSPSMVQGPPCFYVYMDLQRIAVPTRELTMVSHFVFNSLS